MNSCHLLLQQEQRINIQDIWKIIMKLVSNLMVAYLTDARCYLHCKRGRFYASWQGYNLFLNPVHNRMHDWIRDWTRNWYPAVITSTVWPVCPPRWTGFRVWVDGRWSHYGVDNSEGGGLFSFDCRFINVLGFKLTGETSVHSGVVLGVWRISWVGGSIQEVSCRNLPPCLINWIFLKLFQTPLVVVGM